MKTNVDMITDFMERGSALNQMFVVDAVVKLAELILENKEEVLKRMEGGFVHGPAWVKCAEDFLEHSNKFYNSPIEQEDDEEC